MQPDWHVERALGPPDPRDMIDMRVGQQDVRQVNSILGRETQQPLDLVTRIDEDPFLRLGAGNDKSILEEGSDRLGLDYDHPVILAIVDDLMFSSKIKTAAKQLGVTLMFARSRDAALTAMRAESPSLVIFDLNNPRTDPLGTIAAMKADPALAAIPTLGFASHVQVETIDAARRAGIDQVMARSGFTEHLGEILVRYQ